MAAPSAIPLLSPSQDPLLLVSLLPALVLPPGPSRRGHFRLVILGLAKTLAKVVGRIDRERNPRRLVYGFASRRAWLPLLLFGRRHYSSQSSARTYRHYESDSPLRSPLSFQKGKGCGLCRLRTTTFSDEWRIGRRCLRFSDTHILAEEWLTELAYVTTSFRPRNNRSCSFTIAFRASLNKAKKKGKKARSAGHHYSAKNG